MSITAAIDEELRPFLEAFDLSPDAVFVTDRRNRIVLWNKALQQLLGFSDHEVVGYSCAGVLLGLDHFGNRYCSDPCPVVQIATRGESIRRFELQLRTKDRRKIQAEVTVLNVVGPQRHQMLLPHIIRPIEKQPVDSPQPAAAPVKPVSSAVAAAHKLTPRELEVLTALASGLSTAEIADQLGISPLTARNHVQNLLDKLKMHSKTEAVAWAFKNKLV